MTEMVCIVCPNGCLLTIDKDKISGNKCKKGEEFAICETVSPKRTLTTTVKTIFPEFPVLPVKLSGYIPKEKIFDCMKAINKIVVKKRLARGEVIYRNIIGLDVDLVVTSSRLLE